VARYSQSLEVLQVEKRLQISTTLRDVLLCRDHVVCQRRRLAPALFAHRIPRNDFATRPSPALRSIQPPHRIVRSRRIIKLILSSSLAGMRSTEAAFGQRAALRAGT
jgi:hypothetical protein